MWFKKNNDELSYRLRFKWIYLYKSIKLLNQTFNNQTENEKFLDVPLSRRPYAGKRRGFVKYCLDKDFLFAILKSE